jgi:oligoribonuclease (3'-5' exoribonuclease)
LEINLKEIDFEFVDNDFEEDNIIENAMLLLMNDQVELFLFAYSLNKTVHQEKEDFSNLNLNQDF